MELHPIDGYLLDGSPTKDAAVAAALTAPSSDAAAQPFYRALKMLGPQVADEALIALRLTLAGRGTSDEMVRVARAHVKAARAGNAAEREAYLALMGTTRG